MLIRTIRCKLAAMPDTKQAFLATKEAFAKACTLVLAKALETKTKDAIKLHRLTYGLIRKECCLSANHNLSKQLVQVAQRHNAGLIRMEQLRGIREKTLVWNPHRNRMMSGWSFSQLQQFVTYKARRVGIAVELVNPAYTSQVCFECRQMGLRCKDVFQCKACGEKPADYNAAGNISIGGAVVNQPKLTVCV